MGNRRWTDEEIQFLRDHEEDYTYDDFDDEMNRSRSAIKKKMNNLGMSAKRKQRQQTLVNHNFFASINTPRKAYTLGFFVADGYIISQQRESGSVYQFGLKNQDQNLLASVRDEMESEHTIYEKSGDCYELVIGSKSIVEDLQGLGFTSNKSYGAHYPDIDQDLDSHFVRGVFDGDGCITRILGKGIPYGCVHFNGTEELMQSINKIIPVSPVSVKRPKENLWRLTLTHRKARSVLDWIYSGNPSLYMERKHQRYQDLKNRVGFYAKP